jgi:signal transduction histidine kinase
LKDRYFFVAMNQIIDFFLSHYPRENSFLIWRKTRIFIRACLFDLLFQASLFTAHWLGGGNRFFLIADSGHFLIVVAVLFLIRAKYLELATNTFILAFLLSISTANVVNDYFNPEKLHYLRMLETTLLFTLAIVIVSLFTFKTYHIVFFVTASIAITIVHYFILINKDYDGQHTNTTILVILVYSLFMVFTGSIAIFSLRSNNNLLQLVERESAEVKRLNQSLESKVIERTQQLELQNKELVKVNNELDNFVYRVSHDLRAPLASVLGLISIAKQETNPEKLKEYLELKEKSVLKLDHFIQDIMNLSKNARSEVVNEAIDFEALIQDIFEEQSFSEQALRIEKIAEVTQSDPFFSDKERLKIVLSNVISNAIRYSSTSREKPFVKVSVKLENRSPLPWEARIEISDNGQGISEEHLGRVFDMFYRASAQKAGTGLGLYIVKETVEKLNGKISVHSKPGVGTSFTIKLNSWDKESMRREEKVNIKSA